MKKISFLFALTALALTVAIQSCVKEPAVEPNAKFDTKLVDNTAYAGETFYLYFKNTRGDFWTLFSGLTPATTYDPANPKVTGTVVLNNTDSLAMTYGNPGTYPLTLVATSSGNWGEEFKKDAYTLNLTVVDRRTGFTSFNIDRIEAVMIGKELIFYAHKLVDISAKKPKWLTASSTAKVLIDGVEQTSGVSVVNFSAVNPGDSEGRPITYTVQAPDGSTETYTAKYVLRDPSPEKKLIQLNVTVPFVGTFIPDESNNLEIRYPAGAALTAVRVQGIVSEGAVPKVGTKEISKVTAVNLVTENKVVVTAEDLTTAEYNIVMQPVEKFTSWSFTKAGGADLNPAPVATIDAATKTIAVTVFPGTNLTSLVASFAGVSTQTVKIGDTVIESGVTEFDYSAKSFELKIFAGDKQLDTYTLTITQ